MRFSAAIGSLGRWMVFALAWLLGIQAANAQTPPAWGYE